MGRALSLKLQVVDEYRLRQRQKAGGHCCAPLQETATQFNVHKSLVSKWAAQEDELRRVLTQTSAVRFSLHPGSKCRFPLAEADTYTACKEHRTNGLRVTARFLRVAMRNAAIHTGAPWRGGGRFISGEPPMASSVRTPTSFEFAPEDQLEAHANRGETRQVQALARAISASATTRIFNNCAAPRNVGSLATTRPDIEINPFHQRGTISHPN